MARRAGYAASYDFSDLRIFGQQAAHVREQADPVFATLHVADQGAQMRLPQPLRRGKTRGVQGGMGSTRFAAKIDRDARSHGRGRLPRAAAFLLIGVMRPCETFPNGA